MSPRPIEYGHHFEFQARARVALPLFPPPPSDITYNEMIIMIIVL